MNYLKIKQHMRVWQCSGLATQGVGGVEKHIHETSIALRRLGHEVHIGQRPPETWDAGRVILHTHGDTWPDMRFVRRQAGHLALYWIHVCHGTSIGRVLACREYTSLSGIRGSLRDFSLAKLSDAVVVVSNPVRDEVKKYYRLRQPIQVISNGADPAIFSPLGAISSKPWVAFLGRGDDRVKNIDRLLAAGAMVYEKHRDFELHAAPGLSGHAAFVRNLGALSGQSLARALKECRALVLCSFYEGDPLVVHEAKSMGLPIIASDIPSLRAALANYNNAFLANPQDTKSIASEMERALYVETRQPSPASRSWDDVARDFDQYYRRLMGKEFR